MAQTTMIPTDVQEKQRTTIADYVGDMTALEAHIEEALNRQLTEVKDDPAAHVAVQVFHDVAIALTQQRGIRV